MAKDRLVWVLICYPQPNISAVFTTVASAEGERQKWLRISREWQRPLDARSFDILQRRVLD